MDKKPTPRLGKAHCKAHAEAYLRAGWRLRAEFREPGYDEPAEYFFEWPGDSEPVRPEFLPKRD
jgi:hypothetical protein